MDERTEKTKKGGYKEEFVALTGSVEKAIILNLYCPYFVNTVRQHFVEYSVGNIQPGSKYPRAE